MTTLRLASLFAASVVLVACGSSSTTNASALTAADVAGAAPAEASPAEPSPASTAPAATSSEKPASKGEVVCRMKDSFGVVNELSITWTSEGGKGVLRRITPSGMEEELRVRAERDHDLILADAPNETDLMSHVAVVSRLHGKLQMRVGSPTPAWFACE